MRRKIFVLILILTLMFNNLIVSFAEDAAYSYAKYYDDNAIYFTAYPQSAPWDFSSCEKDGLMSVKMPLGNHANQYARITLTSGSKAYNAEPIKRTGLLTFKIFVETTEYDVKTDRFIVRLLNDSENNWASTNSVYLPRNMKIGEWVNVSIPLQRFAMYDVVDYSNIKFVEIKRNGFSEKEFNVYIAELGLSCNDTVSLAAKEENGIVELNWWCSKKVANKFDVYRNGNLVGSVKNQTQYSIKASEDKKCSYVVKAYYGSMLVAESVPMTPDVYNNDKTYFARQAFWESRLTQYAENSAIMRVGNNEGYFNNYRRVCDIDNEKAAPYEKMGDIYVPIKRTAYAVGCVVEENADGTLTVFAKGTSVEFSDSSDNTERKNGILFSEAHSLAEKLGVYCVTKDELVILSSQSAIEIMSEDIITEIADSLATKRQNVYLGSLGYVTGVIASPSKPENVYCKTDCGGIYRYDRNENRWEPLMEGIPQKYSEAMSVRSLAIDPSDEDTLYVTGGGKWYNYSSYLLKTTDGGETWNKLKFSGNTSSEGEIRLMGESIAVDGNNSDVVYCGTYTDGLWRSVDGGESWKQVSDIPAEYNEAYPGGVSAVLIDDSEKTVNGVSSKIYVSVLGRGVYASSDGGEHFSLINNTPLMVARMQIAGGKLYMSATNNESKNTNGGFFVYSEGSVTDLSPDTKYKHSMAFMVDRNNPDMIIVVGAPYRSYGDKRVFRTTNGGKTWEGLSTMRNPSAILQDTINENEIWWPYGAGMYLVENMNEVVLRYRSCDYGIEELVATQITSVPYGEKSHLHTLVMDHGHMLNENIFDKATAVTPTTAKGSGFDFCAVDPSYVVRTGFTDNDNLTTSSVVVSVDGGNSFSETSWNSKNRILDVAVSANKQSNGMPVIMVASIGDSSGNDVGIWKSLDFGKNWTKCAELIQNKGAWSYNARILVSDRINGNAFYVLNDDNLYRTKDCGENWELIETPDKSTYREAFSREFIKAVPMVEGGLWIRTADGIHTSYDYGDTWSRIQTDEMMLFGFGKGKTANTPAAYMLGTVNGQYGLYISDDLGVNWRIFANSSADIPVVANDITGDAAVYAKAYIATSGRGVYSFTSADIDEEKPTVELDWESTLNAYASPSNKFAVKGKISEAGSVNVNGNEVIADGYNRFEFELTLDDDFEDITISARDESGNEMQPETLSMRYIPELYTPFYDNLGADDTAIITYVNKGNGYNESENEKMYIAGYSAVNGLANENDHAIRLNMGKTKNVSYQINRRNKNYVDVSDIVHCGELRFKIMLKETDIFDKTAKNLKVQLLNDDSNDSMSSNSVALSSTINSTGKWYDVSIPLSGLEKEGFDWSKVYGISFFRTSSTLLDWGIFVKDIYFAVSEPFEAVIITDTEGKVVQNVSAGKEYTASMRFNNCLGEDMTPAFMVALYDGEKFIEAKLCDDITVKAGKNYTYISEKINVSEDLKEPVLKVFMWKDFGASFSPLMKSQ